jgi:sulfide:quinone oxidoreductase
MRPRVLVAGGGIAAAETVLALEAFAPGLARVEIMAPDADLLLVPASTAAPFDGGRTERIPLARVAERAGATFRRDALAAVEPDTRTVVTASGERIGYGTLVVAVGATRTCYMDDAALTFRGPEDVVAFQRLLDAIENGALRGICTRLAFVVPPGPGWPLPAYELALQAAGHLERAGLRDGAKITLVTAEDAPLAAFGPDASSAVAGDLADAGVVLRTASVVRSWGFGRLDLLPQGEVSVDRIVVLPAVRGPAVPGLPLDRLGFVRTDPVGRAEGLEDVFAVGDAGTFPLKQGGIGCQQADTVASLVAIGLGARMEPVAFEPILRGILRTDQGNRFLRSEVGGGGDESAGVTAEHDPLWWPPGKVAGRFLAPFLTGMEPGRELVDRAAPVPD